MKIKQIVEDGRVVKGVNTTADVKTGETRRQAAKFGNKLDKSNTPPLLHAKAKKNSSPHALSNLGLAESTHLNELFDKVYPWIWQRKSNDQGWIALFKPKAKVAYNSILVNFDPMSAGSGNYQVGFDSPMTGYDKVGGGDEFATFATVIAIIEAFMSENESAESLQFQAKREGDAVNDKDIKNNRAELYKRMLARFAKKHNFEFAWADTGDRTEFIIRRNVANNQDKMTESKKSGAVAYKLQLVRDGDEDVLRVLSNKSPSWVEIRGKQNYETNGYDPKDKLHSFLDKLDPATVAALMSGDTKYLNPNNSRTTPSIAQAKHIMTTEEIKKPKPEDTLGVKRHEMPQVHAQHYPELYKYLADHGATMSKGNIAATKLKAVQSEFSDEGVEKMMRKGGITGDGTKKPLIVSSDNYIIDGHHRWLAAYNLKEVVPIIKVSLPVKVLLQLVRDFKHTTYKDIYNEEGSQNEKTTRTRRSNRNRRTNERRST